MEIVQYINNITIYNLEQFILPLFYLTIGLMVFDVISTVKVLKDNNGKEANPIMRKLMDKIGVIPAMVGTHAIMIGGLLFWQDSITSSKMYTMDSSVLVFAQPSLVFMFTVYLAVGINNGIVLYKLKNRG